jgi:HSP20 family protein
LIGVNPRRDAAARLVVQPATTDRGEPMANITRTNDPFRELAGFDPFREIEPFPTFGRLRRLLQEVPAEPTIRIDVAEDDKAYTVKAELPGVKKEDIAVDVDGNQVSISAQVRREKEEKKGETVHSERYYGRQYRSFALARAIERDKVEAKYHDGILEITLPKNGGAPASKIAIR